MVEPEVAFAPVEDTIATGRKADLHDCERVLTNRTVSS